MSIDFECKMNENKQKEAGIGSFFKKDIRVVNYDRRGFKWSTTGLFTNLSVRPIAKFTKIHLTIAYSPV